MSSTRVTRHLQAPRARVYRAFLDAKAVENWMVPTGMTSQVHAFEGKEGGVFRISLTYDAPTGVGKTTAHTDTYHGRFVTLVPNERIVAVHDNLPPGLSAADNETGWGISLDKLEALLEAH
jgi:uncharacterized protein YndB with AHSA1/START domain